MAGNEDEDARSPDIVRRARWRTALPAALSFLSIGWVVVSTSIGTATWLVSVDPATPGGLQSLAWMAGTATLVMVLSLMAVLVVSMALSLRSTWWFLAAWPTMVAFALISPLAAAFASGSWSCAVAPIAWAAAIGWLLLARDDVVDAALLAIEERTGSTT